MSAPLRTMGFVRGVTVQAVASTLYLISIVGIAAAIASPALPAGAVALVIAPIYGLLLPVRVLVMGLIVTLLVPVGVLSFFGYSLDASYLLEGMLLVKAAASMLERRRRKTVPGTVGAVALILFSTVSIYLAYGQGTEGLPPATRYALGLAVFVVVARLLPADVAPRDLLRFLIFVGSAYVVYLLIATSTGAVLPGVASTEATVQTPGAELTRVASSQMGPNSFSVFLVLPIMAIQAEALRRKSLLVVLIPSAVAIGYAFVWTFSRNGLVALVVAEMTFILLARRQRIWALIVVATGAVAVMGLLSARGQVVGETYGRGTAFLNVSGPVTTYSPGTALTLSLKERVYLWNGAIRVFASEPVGGRGFGPRWASIPVRPHGARGETFITGAHNSFMTMLAVGGLLGFTALVLFVAPVVVRSVRDVAAVVRRNVTKDGEDLARMAIVSWLVASTFSSLFDDILYFNLSFTTLWGIAAIVLFRSLPPWRSAFPDGANRSADQRRRGTRPRADAIARAERSRGDLEP